MLACPHTLLLSRSLSFLGCTWSILHAPHSKRTSYVLRMRARARCLMCAATPAATWTSHVSALELRAASCACASSKDVASSPSQSTSSTLSSRICISNFCIFALPCNSGALHATRAVWQQLLNSIAEVSLK